MKAKTRLVKHKGNMMRHPNVSVGQNLFGKSSFLCVFSLPRHITIIQHKCYLYIPFKLPFFSVSDIIIGTGISDVFQN